MNRKQLEELDNRYLKQTDEVDTNLSFTIKFFIILSGLVSAEVVVFWLISTLQNRFPVSAPYDNSSSVASWECVEWQSVPEQYIVPYKSPYVILVNWSFNNVTNTYVTESMINESMIPYLNKTPAKEVCIKESLVRYVNNSR